MIIAIDFDGTLVRDDRDYHDVTTPLEFMPGAKEALVALRAAGHLLVLNSARASRHLREDWGLNPMWRDGLVPFDKYRWAASLRTNILRFQQMVQFVNDELPGVFSYIDDGSQGKVSADLYVDDKALRYGMSVDWPQIALAYGESSDSQKELRDE